MSKKNAKEILKTLPENKIIQKINNASLKQKILLVENFVNTLIQNKILEEN